MTKLTLLMTQDLKQMYPEKRNKISKKNNSKLCTNMLCNLTAGKLNQDWIKRWPTPNHNVLIVSLYKMTNYLCIRRYYSKFFICSTKN